ncbi:MAG: hypothetical protein D6675_15410 [Gemmatimonadetes bacterium]|nr:MAG: hypothetical protein D6675_15410 [Gemmatimonadota bacterium]
MARQQRQTKRRSRRMQTDQNVEMLFGKQNILYLVAGLIVITIGFIFLGSSRDGFLAMYVSPILLVGGYCGLLPLAILYKDKE